jgi:hypothetical protein
MISSNLPLSANSHEWIIANDELGVWTFSIDGALCIVCSLGGCCGTGRTVEVVDSDERRMETFR